MSVSLYELTGQIMDLFSMAEDEDVGLDVINDTFEALSMEFEEKAEQYAIAMKNLEGEAEIIEKEIKRLTDKKKVLTTNADRIKKQIEKAMKASGNRKFQSPNKLFNFSIQRNAPSLDTVNEEFVPDDYWVQQDPKLDRTKLLAAVKADPKAFEGIATIKQTESIRIK